MVSSSFPLRGDVSYTPTRATRRPRHAGIQRHDERDPRVCLSCGSVFGGKEALQVACDPGTYRCNWWITRKKQGGCCSRRIREPRNSRSSMNTREANVTLRIIHLEG